MNRLLALLVLCLLVGSVSAYKDTFQNGYYGWTVASTDHGTITFDSTPQNYDQIPVVFSTSAWSGGCMPIGICYGSAVADIPDAPPSTYWAWNEYAVSGSTTMYLDGETHPALSSNIWHRIEWSYTAGSDTLKAYVDGAESYSAVVDYSLLLNPAVQAAGYTNPTSTIYIDDFTWGLSPTDTSMISTIPQTWSIRKDLLDPSIVGVYDDIGTLQSTTEFHIQASTSPYLDGWVLSSPPDSRYTIEVTSPTGVHIFDTTMVFTTLGSPIGTYTIPINVTHIGNAPLEYGLYSVVLYSNGAQKGASDYFMVTASGAVISFDKDLYHAGDTAVLSYTITPAYYNTVTYSYTYQIQDIYGDIKSTGDITSSSGTVSVSTSDYTQGVYYATIVATQKASPNTKYILGWDVTEMVETLYLNGYVMNAETGGVLDGANVSITQGSHTNFSHSIPSGAWNSSAAWSVGAISINTSLTGYTPDLRAFTALSSKTVNLNISLMPNPPTAVGVTIGGIVRDDVFGNPIPAATYHVGAHTATTNIAGFARVGSLVHGTAYDVYSTKAGYSDSTHHSVTAVGA